MKINGARLFSEKMTFTSTIDSCDSSFSIADVTLKNLRNKLFHVAMRLRSNKSQITSKCGKKKQNKTTTKKVTHEPQVSV